MADTAGTELQQTDEQKAATLRMGQYATALNDITIPFFTDVLTPLDDVLMSRGGIQALKFYDEIERDPHAFAVLTKRKAQLVAREWIVKPGGEAAIDIQAAEFIEDVLAGIDFDDVCKSLLDATLKGFAVGEAVYRKDGRHKTLDRIVSLEQRRFVFDLNWKPRLVTTFQMMGERLPERKFIVHRFGVKGNNPYGIGLGAKLFWPVQFKRQGLAFWMRYMERFASPIPVGKHVQGAGAAEVDRLMNTLSAISGSSSITIPLGTELDTFESQRSGSGDYDSFAKFQNSEISKAVLGETLTTEMGDVGARAASETHASILDVLVDGDADLLSGTLNGSVIRWLVDANYPGAALPTVWRPRMSNEMAEEAVLEKRAVRRTAEFAALDAARASGFEPADPEGMAAEILGGPVRAVATDTEAQKKTPMIRLSRMPSQLT
ncbi:DUF935 family protein [Loktanella sp. 3ANDIMAR09]|uniref:phage portal protein family protein n=1 Tax=Loktanella sp. 3ANDIMAR09 TaxID=1225657 RepID=UPI0007001F32|nr:DUF935 family protein [Loktanella sp. 3ANDIMAR09]